MQRIARATAFLSRHDALLLLFCSVLFGLAYGLTHERNVVPIPPWYTESLHRFCLLLMMWTALMHSDPLQRLIWSITDCLVLSSPFIAGVAFPVASDVSSLIAYELALGKISAGATFGVAITQGVYSLLPGWRARREKSQSTAGTDAAAMRSPKSGSFVGLLTVPAPESPDPLSQSSGGR